MEYELENIKPKNTEIILKAYNKLLATNLRIVDYYYARITIKKHPHYVVCFYDNAGVCIGVIEFSYEKRTSVTGCKTIW